MSAGTPAVTDWSSRIEQGMNLLRAHNPAWPGRLLLCAALLLQASLATVAQTRVAKDLRDGDLLFQHMGGEQGMALQLATGSPWTHVGIAFRDDGQWQVLEAVGPVKWTPLAEWLEQGNGEFAVMRLAEADRLLNEAALARLREAAEPFVGIGYDWKFGWDDELIYCSELIWKLYERALGIRLCEPKPMRAFDLSDPLVRQVMHDRYGAAPPLDEPMVAPATLMDCPLLRHVAHR